MITNKLRIIKSAITLLVVAFVFGTAATAQTEKGMHFEHGLTWQQVLDKAKAENKFIFVDCYTTWCGPCKMMSAQVFPLEEVGSFYNEKYIMVKVQLDTTKNDDEQVKGWFATGKEFVDKYNVRVYPTYLFFDNKGEIVHRAVGSSDPATFITKGKDALNKETQYYAVKHLYEGGQKDDSLLYKLAKMSSEAYDQPFAGKVAREYLATQKNLLTENNIRLLSNAIQKSTDPGFTELMKNVELFDKYNYPGYAAKTIRMVIGKEEIFPVIAPGGATPVDNPDWKTAYDRAEKKFGASAASEAIGYYKIALARQANNWPAFSTAVSDYVKTYSSNVSGPMLNDYAWTIFEKCDDMACVEKALSWSKQSVAANDKDHAFIDTYANLLYKAGKKKEAIEWETKAKDIATGDDAKGYQATIDKMVKGEKTW